MKVLKAILRVLISAMFAFAGVEHLIKPDPFVFIVPASLPNPQALVYISGLFEILGAIGLLVPGTRRLAGIGLALLLVAVFPANINMAVNDIDFGLPHYLLWWRLPLQAVLIAAVWWVSHPWKLRQAKQKQQSELVTH